MSKRTAVKYKIDRRMGENIWGRAKSPINRREYGPGQHGQRRKGKLSDFGTQLRAKQKLKGYYGNAEIWYMEGPHDPEATPDRGWQSPLNPAQLYRKAIPAFNAACKEKFGKDFKDLAAEQQDEALTALQKGEIRLEPELSFFFATLLANTKEGYFADPVHGGNHGMQAWKYIGFPGARASYAEWVDQHNKKYPLGPVSIKGERA